jgi:hypothetical protein
MGFDWKYCSRKRSILGEPAKQLKRCRELLLLLGGQLLQDCRSEPILPCCAALSEQPLAFVAERHAAVLCALMASTATLAFRLGG